MHLQGFFAPFIHQSQIPLTRKWHDRLEKNETGGLWNKTTYCFLCCFTWGLMNRFNQPVTTNCIGFSLSIGVSKSLMNASTRVESGCTALWFVITGCSNNLAGKSRNFYLHVRVYVHVCLCPSPISTVHLWCSMLLSAVFSQSPKRQVFMPWVFPCLYMHDHIGQ